MHRLSVNWKLIERQAFQVCSKTPTRIPTWTFVRVFGFEIVEFSKLDKVRGRIATGAAAVEVSKVESALHLVDGPSLLSVDCEPIE